MGDWRERGGGWWCRPRHTVTTLTLHTLTGVMVENGGEWRAGGGEERGGSDGWIEHRLGGEERGGVRGGLYID